LAFIETISIKKGKNMSTNAVTRSIVLKGVYIPIGDVSIRVSNAQSEFGTYKGNTIHFTTDSNSLTAKRNWQVTDEEFGYIRNTDPKKPRNEKLEAVLLEQYNDVREFLAYIQAFDSIFKLDPQLRMRFSFEWTDDLKNYYPVHVQFSTSWMGASLLNVVPDNFLGELSKFITTGLPLYKAFRYLYQAYSEDDTRFKWINGTIAAEIAVKEFIGSFDEKLELLLLYMPSPPIDKMYKDIVKEFTGLELETKRKVLQDGANKRNDLVHKHKSVAPGLKETNIYLHQIEVAIFELYKAKYPDRPFFEYSLKRAKGRLKHVEEGGQYYI
jgi:hypothetical protein